MKIRKEIKGVIFDVDGVLLDSLEIWKDLGARYLLSIGIEPEEKLSDTLFSMSMEQSADYLIKHYALSFSSQQILYGIQSMLRDFYYYEAAAKPGALQLLMTLQRKGIPAAVVTASPRELVLRALQRNGLDKYIGCVFTEFEIGKSKHSPDIYLAAAAFMGTLPAETLVFEDTLYALKTAVDAGFQTVGVWNSCGEPNQKELEETAGLYIRDYYELHLFSSDS